MAAPVMLRARPARAFQAAPSLSFLDFVPGSERAGLVGGRSDFDCAPAISRALAVARGPIHFPAGRYPVASPIRFVPSFVGRFAPGPVLIGDGPGRTVFENRRARGAMFEFDSGSTAAEFRAITGLGLSGFTIAGAAEGGRATGIWLRCCFMTRLADLHIVGLPGDGLRIECRNGDNDASNMVELERVRIENCGGWGIRASAEPGSNEISFVRLRHVFVQNCGTPGGGAAPASGGMRYKGQVLTLDQCAFTLNSNVGLYIPGEAGLALNVELRSTAFENNVDRHLLCTGVSVLRASNLQFYSNDRNRVRVACEFDGDTHTVREVRIDGVTVRATAANRPYVGFRFTGRHLELRTCEVRGVIWDDFGYPGQERSSGLLAV